MNRISALAALVLLAVGLSSTPAGRAAAGRCSATLPRGPALPAPVVVRTACGRFRLDPNGSVVFLGAWTSPVPAVASGYFPVDLTWYGVVHRHLVIGRGMKQLWRSQRTYPSARRLDLGAVVLGRHKLAFSDFHGLRSRLLLAHFGRAEHVVGRDETPLTFTTSGDLVSWRYRGGGLELRRGDGRLARRLAAHAVDAQVGPASGMMVFRTGDRVLVFDGVRVRALVSLSRVGVTGRPTLEPLQRLLVIHDLRRLVVLDYDGHVVASTKLPARPKRADGVSSSVVASPAGTAVAFTATSGNSAYGSHGRETIYELAVGQSQARPIFSAEVDFKLCERMAWLAWRGTSVLFGDTEEHAAIVDTSGAAAPVDLSSVIAALPGADPDFDIGWA